MKSNRSPRLLGFLVLGALAASPARAGTVTATFNGFNPNAPVGVTRTLKDPYLTGTSNVVTASQPGRFSFTRTGGDFAGTLVGSSPNQFFAFCIEPLALITQGSSHTFNLTDLANGADNIGGMGATKANLISEMFYNVMPDLSATISDQVASALNVAIWEIVRENPANSLNVLTGDAKFTSNVNTSAMLTLAQGYLSAIDPTGNGPRLTNLYALQLNGVQDVLVQVRPVPEPATWMSLASGGVVALLAFRRRRAAGAAVA